MIEDGQERSAQTSKSRRDQAFPPLPRHYTFISGTTTKKMQSNLPPPQFLGGGGVSYKIACPAISRPIHRGQQFSTGSYPKVLSSANGRSHVCHNSKPFASTPPLLFGGGLRGSMVYRLYPARSTESDTYQRALITTQSLASDHHKHTNTQTTKNQTGQRQLETHQTPPELCRQLGDTRTWN